jgi:hypothetical protein
LKEEAVALFNQGMPINAIVERILINGSKAYRIIVKIKADAGL